MQRRPVKSISVVGSIGVALKSHSDISPIPPVICTGGGSKSAKFGLDFRHQSHLNRSGFQMVQHIGNLKHVTEMVALNTDLATTDLIFIGGAVVSK